MLLSVSATGAAATPQNPIQFQRGMSLSTFVGKFGSEIACEAALLGARSPDGFVGPE